MSAPLSPKAMAELGWTRTGLGLSSRWTHPSGWRLEHCGHPTALHPWALYSPEGKLVLTGIIGPHRNPVFGTAWNTLREAVEFVRDHLLASRGAA